MARQARSTRSGATAATVVRGIDSFGRVSKRVVSSSSKKATTATASTTHAIAERFMAQQQKEQKPQKPQKLQNSQNSQKLQKTQITIEIPAASQQPPSTASRKRRAAESDETPSKSSKRSRPSAPVSIISFFPPSSPSPTNQKNACNDASSSDDCAEKSTSRLLSRLNLRPSQSRLPSALPRSTSSSPRPASTAPTTPCEASGETDDEPAGNLGAPSAVLPTELLDLLRLQSAFAKALALHYAHHGSHAPVDIRELCPSVAQAWGKRRVTLEDVQRCIGVVAGQPPNCKGSNGDKSGCDLGLFLSDYSRGKICIELPSTATAGCTSTLGRELDDAFAARLRELWSDAVQQEGSSNVDVKQFIQSLPKAPITKCTSLLQTSAVRAKGQRTLEELMNGIALKKQEKQEREAKEAEALKTAASQPTTPAAPMSLLDRIRYRQLQRTQQQAAGIMPPTPEELERRAALHRACDIADVLCMLCTSARHQSRVSFGMVAILTKIKDSLRLPVSREEAASCVRLLAKEVAPQWIQIISMGGREIIIMLPDFVPSKTALQARVESLS